MVPFYTLRFLNMGFKPMHHIVYIICSNEVGFEIQPSLKFVLWLCKQQQQNKQQGTMFLLLTDTLTYLEANGLDVRSLLEWSCSNSNSGLFMDSEKETERERLNG